MIPQLDTHTILDRRFACQANDLLTLCIFTLATDGIDGIPGLVECF